MDDWDDDVATNPLDVRRTLHLVKPPVTSSETLLRT